MTIAGFRHDWDAIQRLKDGLTIDAQALPALTSTLAKLIPATSRQYNDNFWVKHTGIPKPAPPRPTASSRCLTPRAIRIV